MRPSIWSLTSLWSLTAAVAVTQVVPVQASGGDHVNQAPTPPTWPHQFHAVLFSTNTSRPCNLVDLWYDWPNGRNLNLISSQLGVRGVLHDVEYNNHTSFYYDLGKKTCRKIRFPVGILKPDWLQGAVYNGQEEINTFMTHSFTQGDGFITYWYEVAAPHRPVRWRFYDSAQFEVLSWTEGAVLEDSQWQAPPYCFTQGSIEEDFAVRTSSGADGQLLTSQRSNVQAVMRPGTDKGISHAALSTGEGEEPQIGWYFRQLALRLIEQTI